METAFAYADLHHRSGLRLRIAFPLDSEHHPAGNLNKLIDGYLAAGFSVREPGVEPGQETEEVGFVVRTLVAGRSGQCSRIFFYSPHEKVIHKVLDKYLNDENDIREFEAVSGLKLASVAVWPAKAPPTKTDGGNFIVRTKPFSVIAKANPDYVEGSKETTKRLFVRYGGQSATKHENVQQNANTATGGHTEPDVGIVKDFEERLGHPGLTFEDVQDIQTDIRREKNLTPGGREYLKGLVDQALANFTSQEIPF